MEEKPPEVKNGHPPQTWPEVCRSRRGYTSSRAPSDWRLLHSSQAIVNWHTCNPESGGITKPQNGTIRLSLQCGGETEAALHASTSP